MWSIFREIASRDHIDNSPNAVLVFYTQVVFDDTALLGEAEREVGGSWCYKSNKRTHPKKLTC